MKKLYKKILSFTLAIVLLAALAVTAFAANLAAEPYTMMIHGAEWTVREEGNVTYFKPPADWYYPGTIQGISNWKPPSKWEMELVNWAPALSGNRTPNRMPAELAVERYIGLLGRVKSSVAVSLGGWVFSSGMLDDMIIGLLHDELLEPAKLTDMLSGLLIDLVYDTINDLTGDFFPDEILGVPLVFDPAQILADIVKDLMLGNPQYDGEGNEYYPESVLQVILESDFVEQIIWRTVMQIWDEMDKGPLVDMFMDIMIVDLSAGTWRQGNPTTTLLIGNWSGSDWNSFGLNAGLIVNIIGAAISGNFDGLIDINNMSADLNMDMLTEIIDLDLALEIGLDKAMEVGMEYLYYYLDKGLAYGITYVYNLAIGYLNDYMERDTLIDPYGRDMTFKELKFSDFEISIWQWRPEGYHTVVYGKNDVGEGLRSLDKALEGMFDALLLVVDTLVYETIGDRMEDVMAIVQLTGLAGGLIGDLFGFDISEYIDYVSNYLLGLTNCRVYGHVRNPDSVFVPAACTSDGLIRDYCLLCLTTIKLEILPATGHNPLSTSQTANCYQHGYTRQTCSTCSLILSQVDIPQREHAYDLIITPPTCVLPGGNLLVCLYDDCDWYSAIGAVAPALGHDPLSVTVAATCTTEGNTDITCSRCDFHEIIPLAVLGHDLKTVTVDATCTIAGSSTLTCSRCDFEEITALAALGHIWLETSHINATLTAPGSLSEECSRCLEKRNTPLERLWFAERAKIEAVLPFEVSSGLTNAEVSSLLTNKINAIIGAAYGNIFSVYYAADNYYLADPDPYGGATLLLTINYIAPATVPVTIIHQTWDGYALSETTETVTVGANYNYASASYEHCVFDKMAPGSAPATGIAGSAGFTVTFLYESFANFTAYHILKDSGGDITHPTVETLNDWPTSWSWAHPSHILADFDAVADGYHIEDSLGNTVTTHVPGGNYKLFVEYLPVATSISGTEPLTVLEVGGEAAAQVIADFIAYQVLVTDSGEQILYGPEYLYGWSADFAWNHNAFAHLYTPAGYHYEDIYGNVINNPQNGETYILKVKYRL
ncbi:MAG: hypothetical protein FWG43_03420 [Clostridiales bacterium]|nr:hypothetical protein [Clostridiales bacterium]